MVEKGWGFYFIRATDKGRRLALESEGHNYVISPASCKKAEQLEWFRKFAYSDFDQLTDVGKARLFAEYLSWSDPVLDGIGYHAFAKLPQEFKDVQTMFSGTFKTIMDNLARASESAVVKWRNPEEGSFRFAYIDEDPSETQTLELTPEPLSVSLFVMPYLSVPKKNKIENEEIKKYKWETNWQKKSHIRASTGSGENRYSFLLFRFFGALDGLTFNMCVRCEECGQWFFNLYMRRKIFCSNRCAKRKDMRDYRRKVKESDSDKHLSEAEEGRLRAKLSYLNMRAESYPKYRKKATELREQIADLKKRKRLA